MTSTFFCEIFNLKYHVVNVQKYNYQIEMNTSHDELF